MKKRVRSEEMRKGKRKRKKEKRKEEKWSRKMEVEEWDLKKIEELNRMKS